MSSPNFCQSSRALAVEENSPYTVLQRKGFGVASTASVRFGAKKQASNFYQFRTGKQKVHVRLKIAARAPFVDWLSKQGLEGNQEVLKSWRIEIVCSGGYGI
jgi:hypothetical protein